MKKKILKGALWTLGFVVIMFSCGDSCNNIGVSACSTNTVWLDANSSDVSLACQSGQLSLLLIDQSVSMAIHVRGANGCGYDQYIDPSTNNYPANGYISIDIPANQDWTLTIDLQDVNCPNQGVQGECQTFESITTGPSGQLPSYINPFNSKDFETCF